MAMLTRATGEPDFVTAPVDYDQLFRQYWGFTVGLVQKLGIPHLHAEDVAADIFTRLIERDVLSMFDPKLKFTRAGEVRSARFKSFWSAHVEHYTRGKRDSLQTRSRREPAILDAPAGPDGTTLLELHVPFMVPDFSDFADAEVVEFLYEYLQSVPRRSKQDKLDLPLLFERVLEQIRINPEIGHKEPLSVAELMKGPWSTESGTVSSTAMHSWLAILRGHVRAAVAAFRS